VGWQARDAYELIVENDFVPAGGAERTDDLLDPPALSDLHRRVDVRAGGPTPLSQRHLGPGPQRQLRPLHGGPADRPRVLLARALPPRRCPVRPAPRPDPAAAPGAPEPGPGPRGQPLPRDPHRLQRAQPRSPRVLLREGRRPLQGRTRLRVRLQQSQQQRLRIARDRRQQTQGRGQRRQVEGQRADGPGCQDGRHELLRRRQIQQAHTHAADAENRLGTRDRGVLLQEDYWRHLHREDHLRRVRQVMIRTAVSP
jgi:hypothetical protein